ncbi:MAG TPA: TolC family protein [Terriglobales bacterium]|nr:TolC family protein [Terriglobales bacterium]
MRAAALVVLGLGAALAAQAPAPLSGLVAEALRANPQLRAARLGVEASAAVAAQRRALPDTQLAVQQLAVGTPVPFAGYANSDFAYIGLGASQEIPFPGKRALRAEVATHATEVDRRELDATQRAIVAQLETDYYELASLQANLATLVQQQATLRQLEQVAGDRYRVGEGRQQDVLQAQVQQTRILAEISDRHRLMADSEARLKQELGRPQTSVDVVAEPLAEHALTVSLAALLAAVSEGNPGVRADQARIEAAGAGVALARKEFKPDFNASYMWQHTASQFRDYYMATFSLNLPNRGRHKAELAQATSELDQAQALRQQTLQAQQAEVARQYAAAQNAAEQLRILNQGLLPQAQAEYRSAVNAYQIGAVDFQALLAAFLDQLDLEMDRQDQLQAQAAARAALTALTGVPLS